MEFKPLNRMILATRCEDPRTHGPVIVSGQSVPFGLVVAIDATPIIPTERARPDIGVGDLIYFGVDAYAQVILDGDQTHLLVNEQNVLGVVKAGTFVEKRLDATPEKPNSGLALQLPNGQHVANTARNRKLVG